MERPKGVRNWKHGEYGTGAYWSWAALKGRCQNPNDARYESYGGRGIAVCERWQDFRNFLADMGQRDANLSIDRIDNDGNYSCGKCDQCAAMGWAANCRWATATEQNNNSSNVRWIEHDGIRDNVLGWAKRLGCDVRVLHVRLHKGWSVPEALSPPFCRSHPKRNSKRIEFSGELLTIPQWAAKTGIPRNVINYRLSARWTVEQSLTEPVSPNHRSPKSREPKP